MRTFKCEHKLTPLKHNAILNLHYDSLPKYSNLKPHDLSDVLHIFGLRNFQQRYNILHIPFSVAMVNVKLLHECSRHQRIGTTKMKPGKKEENGHPKKGENDAENN